MAKLQALKAELRRRMHEPITDVGAWLRKVVTGYHRYHAVPGNIDRLSIFGQRLRRLWWLILRRRSQRRRSWDRDLPIFQQWIPAPRVLNSSTPLPASSPRHSSKVGAVCVEALVRICAGAISDDCPYRVHKPEVEIGISG